MISFQPFIIIVIIFSLSLSLFSNKYEHMFIITFIFHPKREK